MKTFTLKDLLFIHRSLLERYGGEIGIRKPLLLKEVILILNQKEGTASFSWLFERGAFLAATIMKSRPFISGNEVLAYGLTAIFLKFNGFHLKPCQEAPQMIKDLASSQANVQKFAAWLEENTTLI